MLLLFSSKIVLEIYMRKKIWSIVLIAILLLSTVSCNNNPGLSPSPSNSQNPNETNTQEPTPTASNTENPEPTNSVEPTETSSPQPSKDPHELAIEEREALEAQRKEEDGEFYVPLKPLDAPAEKPNGDDVRALYILDAIISKNLGSKDMADWRIDRLEDKNVQLYKEYVIALAEKDYTKINELKYLETSLTVIEKLIGIVLGSEMNAIVFDIKSGDGEISIPVKAEAVLSVQDKSRRMEEVEKFLKIMKEYGIYTIGRVTSFQDNLLASHQDYKHAIKNTDGSIWLDDNRSAWVDAFDDWVQDYNIAVAKEGALAGFDEINFDYVRFPEGRKWGQYYHEYMKNHGGVRSDDIIYGYLAKAYEALAPYNVNVSADIFGLVSRQWDSDDCFKIGQNWYKVAPVVDYICPMIYPSHYSTGWYGFEYPDQNPYGMVLNAMMDSIEKNSAFKDKAKIRLWIQDFTARYLYTADNIFHYRNEQLYDQVRALRELGAFQYMFWNNGVDQYAEKYLFPQNQSEYPKIEPGKDYLGRTPADTARRFLSVLTNPSESTKYLLYVLVPIDSREEHYDVWLEKEFPDLRAIKMLGYNVDSFEITDSDGNEADVTVTLRYNVGDDPEQVYRTSTWKAVKEYNVWKVFPDF